MRRHNQRLYRGAVDSAERRVGEDVMQEPLGRAFTHLNQFARQESSTPLTKTAAQYPFARLRGRGRIED